MHVVYEITGTGRGHIRPATPEECDRIRKGFTSWRNVAPDPANFPYVSLFRWKQWGLKLKQLFVPACRNVANS